MWQTYKSSSANSKQTLLRHFDHVTYQWGGYFEHSKRILKQMDKKMLILRSNICLHFCKL